MTSSRYQILDALNKIADDYCQRTMLMGSLINILPQELISIIQQNMRITVVMGTMDNKLIIECDSMRWYNSDDCMNYKICCCSSRLTHKDNTKCRHAYMPKCSSSDILRNCIFIPRCSVEYNILHYIVVCSDVYLHISYFTQDYAFLRCEHTLVKDKIINMMYNGHKLMMLRLDGVFEWVCV
jgi:hypothetical protein